MSLSKTALVIGGFGGVGQEVVKNFLAEGYHVVLVFYSSSAKEVEQWFKKIGGDGRGFIYQADICKRVEVDKLLQKIKEHYPTIDACVQCATDSITRKKILSLTEEELRRALEVDVVGSFNILQAVGLQMKDQKNGALVAISSIAAEHNVQAGALSGYVVGKYALRGLLRELALELASHQVTVNAVAPSFMRTNLTSDIPERADEFILKQNPMHRMVSPKEVADAVTFLCSEKNKSITGMHVLMSAGEVMNL